MDIDALRQSRQATQAEYERLQLQLKKNRRFIYIGSCLICLAIGFLVGAFVAYPRERTVVVSVEEPQPEAP